MILSTEHIHRSVLCVSGKCQTAGHLHFELTPLKCPKKLTVSSSFFLISDNSATKKMLVNPFRGLDDVEPEAVEIFI